MSRSCSTRLALGCVCFAFALLVAIDSTLDAQQKHPAEDKGAKSVKSDFTSSLRFVNNGTQAVKVYWLDFEGKRVLLAQLQPGDSYEISKAPLNHPYVTTDDKDNATGLYYGDAQARTVVVGPPLAGGGKGGFAGGGGGFGGFAKGISSTFKGLQNANLQDDIKLDQNQLAKLADLIKKDTADRDAAKVLPAAEASKRVAEIIKESDQAAAAILTPAQSKRIQQIKLQHPIGAVWTNTNLAQALKLSPEQQTQFTNLKNEMATQTKGAGPGAFGKGANLDTYQKQLVEIRATFHAKAEGILDPAQQKTWQEMVGPPCKHYLPATVFTIPEPATKKGGGRFKGAGPGPAGTFSFNNYTITSARFLNEKSVQADLKLTPEQTARLTNITTKAALPTDVLTPAQLQRYQAIYVQQAMTAYGPAGAFRWKVVHDLLNLTEEQRRQILEIGVEDANAIAAAVRDGLDAQKVRAIDKTTQDKLERVLNAEQRSKLTDFLGTPFKGALDNPYRAGNASGLRSSWMVSAATDPNKK